MTRLDTDSIPEGMANAAPQHRATDAPHEALLHGLRLPVGIAFADGPAVEWLEQAGPIVAKLNEESKRD